MYSEDFDEGSVEFLEDDDASKAPKTLQEAGYMGSAVPLDDAELDAYLATDGEDPTQQEQVPARVVDHPPAPAAAASQQSLTSNSAAESGMQPAAEAHTGQQPLCDGESLKEEPSSASISHEEEEVLQEEEEEEEAPGMQAQPGHWHSTHAAVHQEPGAAAVPAMQESLPVLHQPSTAGTSGRTSSSSSSPGGSMHDSQVVTAGQPVSAVQELQEMWHATGLPATAMSAADGLDEGGAARSGSASPAHATRLSTHSILQDSSPVQQQRARQRPASASPAIRRSSSSNHGPRLQKQQYCCDTSSPGQHQQQLQVLPVASWTVNDVCDWVDGLGLSQYRKKFMHNVVNGSLLLRLTDQLLRSELGIGPLGHRVLILDGIQAVASADLQQAASAALAGTSPEEFLGAAGCSSPGAAAALLVAGLIALKAGQRGSSRCSSPYLQRIGSGSLGASPVSGAERPGASTAGSPAVLRARPTSAPCKGKGGQRPASPAGGRRSPSPGALGPAAGRISVYEQRAKILFELGRAQARAACTAGTASEVTSIAQLAQKEVAMLQGQLADLDRKNKMAVQHASGSVDSGGIIPWRHVGNGTNAANPHPERLARPWDSPDVELTFKPKISARSKQLMAEARGSEGTAGFLDRLGNDMRRREAKQKELEKRYYVSAAAAEAAKGAKAAAADLATLAAFFSQRGWATLSVPGSTSSSGKARPPAKLTEADFRELDSQLDEVVETYSEELGLGKSDSKHSHAIIAAHGPKKLAAVVAAVRTVQFMDRYHADLSTRGSRLQQLQDAHRQQPVSPGPGRPAVMPLTTEQKDLAQAARWFKGMGWEEAESDDCDDLLSALIKRAQHYKKEAEKLHEKERAAATAAGAAPAAAAAHAAVLPHATINWASAPWSVDGLGPLMQAVMDARKPSAEEAAATQPAGSKQQKADAKGSAAVSAATLEAAAASGANTLDLSVRLLAGMRWAGLEQLDAAKGGAKKLAVYRALRTQQFLAFTATDLANREAKQKVLLQEFEASRRGKLVSQAELDEFYQRLQADGERRKAELEKARQDKADREAKALALVTVGPGFSRRPRSAK